MFLLEFSRETEVIAHTFHTYMEWQGEILRDNKELTHAVTKAATSQDLQLASWTASGVRASPKAGRKRPVSRSRQSGRMSPLSPSLGALASSPAE